MPRANLQPVTVRTGNTSLPPRLFPYVAYAANDPQAVERQLDTSSDEPIEWTEEDVVFLHCLLLDELNALADPATPLEEKLDTLRWVFTDPDKDDKPFSFASCVRVVGCSPLSTYSYCGLVDLDAFRDLLLFNVRRWMRESLNRFPPWVSEALSQNMQWASQRLSKNPQWINEQIKRKTAQGDLFV